MSLSLSTSVTTAKTVFLVSQISRMFQGEASSLMLVAPQELALTRRTPASPPVLMPHPIFGRSSRARPHTEDTSIAFPISGRHGCRSVSFWGDPVSFTCHMFDPASCTVCVPRCPIYTTLYAVTICFYVPVTQLYISPCPMCHLPVHSHV